MVRKESMVDGWPLIEWMVVRGYERDSGLSEMTARIPITAGESTPGTNLYERKCERREGREIDGQFYCPYKIKKK